MGLVVAMSFAMPAAAQDFAFGWNPRTGDAAMDARLADINQYGDRYRAAFVDELVRYHAAPRTLVGALLADEHWAPGDHAGHPGTDDRHPHGATPSSGSGWQVGHQ